MKLATLRDGSRDGQLIVVSRDLTHAHLAHHIAPTLQRALDDWSFIAPQLEDLYESLNQNKGRHSFSFDAQGCLAPLPRAYAHYKIHDTAIQAMPSDQCIGGLEPVRFLDETATKAWVPSLAAITDHVAIAAGPKESATRTLLIMMSVQWMQAQSSAPAVDRMVTFGPVAVTPDELGGWPMSISGDSSKIGKALWRFRRNDEAAVSINTPVGFGDFGAALSQIARARSISAGTIVSMPLAASDALMMTGDRLRVDLKLEQKHSMFGEIDQTVITNHR